MRGFTTVITRKPLKRRFWGRSRLGNVRDCLPRQSLTFVERVDVLLPQEEKPSPLGGSFDRFPGSAVDSACTVVLLRTGFCLLS